MSQNEAAKIIDKNKQEIVQLIDQNISVWTENILFTWQWWLGVVLTISPWVLWTIFRKKNCTDRLLYVALFVMIIASFLDTFGVQMGLWYYKYEVIPMMPTYAPWDFTLMPVTILFFLQVKPKVNPWLKAFIFAGIASFVAEPISNWLQLYEPKEWRYIYSFPIQVSIYLLSHYISRRNRFSQIN